MLEIALNDCERARKMSEELPRGLVETSGIYGRALDMVINEALYGDHSNSYKLLSAMLHEEENAQLSRLCVKESEISEKDVDKIIKDCILSVKQFYVKYRQSQLTEAMRRETDPAKRMELLKQLTTVK